MGHHFLQERYMNLSITGHNLEVTDALNAYVKNKMRRIHRHFDGIISTQVLLSIDRLKHNAQATLRVQGKDIHCQANDSNLYAAIDLLVDKIDRKVLKYKNKLQTYHTNQPLKRQEAF